MPTAQNRIEDVKLAYTQQISSIGITAIAPPPHKKRMLLKSFGDVQKSENALTDSQQNSTNVSSDSSRTVKQLKTYSRRKIGYPKSQ